MPQDQYAAYVFLDIGAADVKSVERRLSGIDGVKIISALIGPDDMLCYVEADGFDGFCTLLDGKIRALIDEGIVSRTETMPVFMRQFSGYGGQETRHGESAWVFINIGVGDPIAVTSALTQIEGVVNAHALLGRFDICALATGDTWKDLMTLLDERIRNVPNIVHTDTRLVLMKKS